MFIGRYYHKLDEKNRVSLPKSFRAVTSEWVISRGLDGGLFLFEKEKFERELEQLAERSFTKKNNRDFIRLMSNDAKELEIDKNGRVLLPEYLTDLAEIKNEVVIVGSYSRIEIWDRKRYHKYLDETEEKAEAIAERLEKDA